MTEDKEFRILIVDDQRDVARVLRASLELLNRGYVIVDVPSAEEATLEMSGKAFDLIVSDYNLPGMTGPEFLQRVRKRHPDVRAIMISGHPLDEVRARLKEREVEVAGVFEKPLDTQAFTNAVEKALHGEEKAAARPAAAGTSKLGPVPDYDERTVVLVLGSLLADLGASAVTFVSREGNVSVKQGQIGESLRFSELAVLLATNFTTTAEISAYLGEGPSGAVHYYDGKEYDIFAMAVGFHYFLAVIFSGDNQKQMGPVLRFGRTAVDKIVESLGEAAFAADGIEGVKPVEKKAEKPAEKKEEKKEEKPAAKKEEKPARAKAKEPARVEEPEEEEMIDIFGLENDKEEVKTVEIDFAALDAELNLDGDLDSFWDEAASGASAANEDALSMDEALELGFMDLDE